MKPAHCQVLPEVQEMNELHRKMHEQNHVLPRLAAGKRILMFDPKCDYTIFHRTVKRMEQEWDKEDELSAETDSF